MVLGHGGRQCRAQALLANAIWKRLRAPFRPSCCSNRPIVRPNYTLEPVCGIIPLIAVKKPAIIIASSLKIESRMNGPDELGQPSLGPSRMKVPRKRRDGLPPLQGEPPTR